jgi:hypothetical protein
MLFPARSGKGKSTLVAALAASGFEYLSDELGIIDLSTCRIIPYRKRIAVKSGSVESLMPYYPELADEHHSTGRRVRYLHHAEEAPPASPRLAALVFPHYQSEHETQLQLLGKLDALERLRALSFGPARDEGQRLRKLVELVSSIPCYALSVASLPDAVALLRDMAPSGAG